MTARLLKAFGYQDDPMNLPVADVAAAVPFYERVMGFRVVEQDSAPSEPADVKAVRRIVLERDGVRMAIAENGGDPTQDGVAFHVDDVEALYAEFCENGWRPPAKDERFSTEDHGDISFKVFYVVAPDGLCFWFGQKI